MRNCIIAAVVLGLLTWQAARASEREMNRVLGQWQQQMAEFEAALSVADSEERRAMITPPSPEEIAPALWRSISGVTGTKRQLSKAEKKSAADIRANRAYEFEQEWAAPAVVWFINHADAFANLFRNDATSRIFFAEALLNSVLNTHFASPIIAEACPKLAESTSEKVFNIVEKIFTHNTAPAARACAALTLSSMLANPSLSASEGGDARVRSKRIYYIKQALSTAPGSTMYGSMSLTQAATEQIYHLRNLSTGAVPPQFQVTTQEGATATFPVQGKANLIFFWSPEEDTGLSIMRKQLALKTRYPELVLCPIVPHSSREEWQSMLSTNNITTCYMDDEKGTVGLSYRVSMLPMVVLVNERSRILYIGYPNMQLQTALDNLFSDKAAAGAKPAQAPPAPEPEGASDTPPALRPMPQF